MKIVKLFLSISIIAILFTSCTTSQSAYDDNYERTRRVGDRVYVDDPYYGTVILEKDPFTGRYYDVTNGYSTRTYGYPYNNYNRYRAYRNNRVYRNYGNTQRPSSSQDVQQNRQEARKKVLGN